MSRKPITYQGQSFSSVTELARHLGITRYVLTERIEKGLPESLWGSKPRTRQHTNESLDELILKRHLKVERVGNLVDTKTNLVFRCLIHDELHPAQPSNVLQGSGLKCCAADHAAKQGRAKRDAAAAIYDKALAEANQFVARLGDYEGRANPIWHLCTKHWEWRCARPGDVLNGHGLKCCLIESNTARAHANRDRAKSEYIEYLKEYESGSFELVGDYVDRDTPVDHCCKRHNKTLPTRPGSLLGRQKMLCCGKEAWAAQGQRKMAEAAADFVERLAVANPDIELIGEYMGTNNKTLFRCKRHGETHLASPKQRLRGQGLHCCHVANGQAMGRLTGPLNGWQGDSVWQSLISRSTRHGEAWIYLFDSPDTELLKYGIASNVDDRRRRSWLPGYEGIRYGALLIEPRRYAERDQAVLVEAAYQFSYGFEANPSLGIGWTELTDRSPEEFLSLIEELETALLEMGEWDFAEEFCDPLQFEKAKAIHAGE